MADTIRFKRRVELGTFGRDTEVRGRTLRIGLDIEVRDTDKGPELSICGDTSYPGARDIESGGQILDDVRRLIEDKGATLTLGGHAYADRPSVMEQRRAELRKLLEVWERWHLNGMRPGCPHQVGPDWDTSAELVLVRYRLTAQTSKARHDLQRSAEKALLTGASVQYQPAELRLMRLAHTVTLAAEAPPPGLDYEEQDRETKRAGWVYPKEHPRGLLCRPCLTCGYEYGSAWLYEPLPADVIEFVQNF